MAEGFLEQECRLGERIHALGTDDGHRARALGLVRAPCCFGQRSEWIFLGSGVRIGAGRPIQVNGIRDSRSLWAACVEVSQGEASTWNFTWRYLGQRLKQAPVAISVSVGQIGARDLPAESQMIEPEFPGLEASD